MRVRAETNINCGYIVTKVGKLAPTCAACDRSETAFKLLADHGERQTELRHDVLRALHHAPRPVGAYDLFNQLRNKGRASAPPAVYRVLDFLVARGLVHKLPSISAYAACKSGPHADHSCFLICTACGKVDEIETEDLEMLGARARSNGFAVRHVNVEVAGLCPECRSR